MPAIPEQPGPPLDHQIKGLDSGLVSAGTCH